MSKEGDHAAALFRPVVHDTELFLQTLARPDARLVPINGESVLVEGEDIPSMALPLLSQCPDAVRDPDSLIHLGEFNGSPLFAGQVASLAILDGAAGAEARFEPLRSLMPLLSPTDWDILGHAKTMIHWQSHNRFCGKCGAPTRSTRNGHSLRCSSEQCGLEIHPRVDPAVLVMAVHGERCLLGRTASWPIKKMYSVIAGFVEPGESLEQAALRELQEETGITATAPAYYGSSPWPFPCSLMIGIQVQALSQAIELRDKELEDAAWFSRRDITNGLASGGLRLPQARSLSFLLLEHWFDQGGEAPLRSLL